MKKQENKKGNKFYLILVGIIVILMIIGIIIILSSEDKEKIINYDDNTIKLSIDGTDFANVFVINGSINTKIINKNDYSKIKFLQISLEEISKNETLPLIGEPELGLIIEYQIPKNNSAYIYAVEEYLREKGFETETIYTE